MDIHHNTFLRSILEHDCTSSSSIACIYSCLGKGAGDAPPNSSIDSTVNPNVNIVERKRIGVRFLTQNISRIKGCVGILRWGKK